MQYRRWLIMHFVYRAWQVVHVANHIFAFWYTEISMLSASLLVATTSNSAVYAKSWYFHGWRCFQYVKISLCCARRPAREALGKVGLAATFGSRNFDKSWVWDVWVAWWKWLGPKVFPIITKFCLATTFCSQLSNPDLIPREFNNLKAFLPFCLGMRSQAVYQWCGNLFGRQDARGWKNLGVTEFERFRCRCFSGQVRRQAKEAQASMLHSLQFFLRRILTKLSRFSPSFVHCMRSENEKNQRTPQTARENTGESVMCNYSCLINSQLIISGR